MHEYKRKTAQKGAQQNNAAPVQAKTNGIPNSALQDVFSGKAHATSEMMGHSKNLAPSIAAKMSRSFGMDLTGMQVYQSDAMVGSGMQGMAQGNKVVLSSDVDLNTTAGQAVLGHEISHIHAQSQGIGMGHSGLYENAALEHQADTEGLLAAQGRSIYQSGAMDMGMGMSYGLGMQGVENVTTLGGGMGMSAGAPMQAKKGGGKAKEPVQDPKQVELEKNQALSDWLIDQYGSENFINEFKNLEQSKLDYSTPEFSGRFPSKKYQQSDEEMDKQVLAGKDMKDLKNLDPEEYEKIKREHIDTSMNRVQSRKFYKTMNQKEKLAMLEYTAKGYLPYNTYLRNGGEDQNEEAIKEVRSQYLGDDYYDEESEEELNKEDKAKVKGFKKLGEKTSTLAGALKRYEAPYDLTLWRSIGADALGAMLGGKEPKAGDVFTDPGFMSASTDKSVCVDWFENNDGNNVILEISVKKGAHVGAPIGDMTANPNSEHEFLLSPNTSLKIVDVNGFEKGPEGNIPRIKCEVVDNASEGKVRK